MNLRSAVAAVAVLFVIVALGAAIIEPATWPLLLMALLFAAGCLFERRRYRAAQSLPVGGDWAPTGERFIDDDSGRPMTVWFNSATGERRYIDDDRL